MDAVVDSLCCWFLLNWAWTHLTVGSQRLGAGRAASLRPAHHCQAQLDTRVLLASGNGALFWFLWCRDWTQGLEHAKHTLYHWTTPPTQGKGFWRGMVIWGWSWECRPKPVCVWSPQLSHRLSHPVSDAVDHKAVTSLLTALLVFSVLSSSPEAVLVCFFPSSLFLSLYIYQILLTCNNCTY